MSVTVSGLAAFVFYLYYVCPLLLFIAPLFSSTEPPEPEVSNPWMKPEEGQKKKKQRKMSETPNQSNRKDATEVKQVSPPRYWASIVALVILTYFLPNLIVSAFGLNNSSVMNYVVFCLVIGCVVVIVGSPFLIDLIKEHDRAPAIIRVVLSLLIGFLYVGSHFSVFFQKFGSVGLIPTVFYFFRKYKLKKLILKK
ncbi:hypothetical protein GEMRC1_014121 [Eukaryota sp. GEM-RC1]